MPPPQKKKYRYIYMTFKTMAFIIKICNTNIHCIDFTHMDHYIFFFYFQGYNNYRKFLLIEEAILRNLVRFSSKNIKTIIFPS